MSFTPKKPRRPRSVPIAVAALKAYLQQTGKYPSDSLTNIMKRGRVQRNNFKIVMQENRIPPRIWYQFLPEGGIDGIEYPEDSRRTEEQVLVWFPNEHHTVNHQFSPLSWIGAGLNDSVESVRVGDPFGKEPTPAIPLAYPATQPVLRIHFKHRVVGLNPEQSWWSAVIGFAPGLSEPEWKTIDISKFTHVRVLARSYRSPNKPHTLNEPIPLLFRFEDDNVDVPQDCLHRSTSWNKVPILLTHWSHPTRLLLQDDFDWEANAFWQKSPPVDKQKILQITLGMDDTVRDCEGFIEIERIELVGPLLAPAASAEHTANS